MSRIAAAGAAAGVALAAALSLHAAAPAVTLGVPGRANANVSLAATGSFVAAVWSGSATGGATDVFAATSHDAGRTFSAATRVNSTPGDARVNGEQPPHVVLRPRGNGAAPEVVVVWTTKGTNGTRLLSAASSDGGKTFAPSRTVPGSDAPGNRGWESVAVGPGGRLFSAWLDHRKLADPQQSTMAAEHHHHEAGSATTAPAAASDMSGMSEMSQLSQLYIGAVDGSVAAKGITGGVCYCCKTSIAAGPGDALYVAWRHVYANNFRDIAFTLSRDGGATFTAPIRVSEDRWQINGCPEDGPSLAVDSRGTVHVIWPTVITENGGPKKALFHAMTRDGKTFTPRERLPIAAQANHPQVAVGADDALMVVWEESGGGTRRLGSAVGRVDAGGHMRFTRNNDDELGRYPAIVSVGAGQWLRAWTTGEPESSQIRVAHLQ